ncbi:MAG: hypothetical protein AAGI53_04590 [Planctomycetota bacterium]
MPTFPARQIVGGGFVSRLLNARIERGQPPAIALRTLSIETDIFTRAGTST